MKKIAEGGKIDEIKAYVLAEQTTNRAADYVEDFKIDSYILFEDENSEGKTQKVVAILTESGEAFATVSKTFVRGFESAVEFLGEKLIEQTCFVGHGISKGGRDFIEFKIRLNK